MRMGSRPDPFRVFILKELKVAECEGSGVACHIGSVLEWLGRMINSVITELWNYVDDPFHT